VRLDCRSRFISAIVLLVRLPKNVSTIKQDITVKLTAESVPSSRFMSVSAIRTGLSGGSMLSRLFGGRSRQRVRATGESHQELNTLRPNSTAIIASNGG
jgi:hypothetical protein